MRERVGEAFCEHIGAGRAEIVGGGNFAHRFMQITLRAPGGRGVILQSIQFVLSAANILDVFGKFFHFPLSNSPSLPSTSNCFAISKSIGILLLFNDASNRYGPAEEAGSQESNHLHCPDINFKMVARELLQRQFSFGEGGKKVPEGGKGITVTLEKLLSGIATLLKVSASV